MTTTSRNEDLPLVFSTYMNSTPQTKGGTVLAEVNDDVIDSSLCDCYKFRVSGAVYAAKNPSLRV